MSQTLTRHRGGGPAPAPAPAPAPLPPIMVPIIVPVPAPVPPPHRIPAAAPHRLQNHTRKHLNTQLRAATASLIGIHRPMRQLQFLLRSLYRRTARTMLENTPRPGRARRRLAGRTLQMRYLVRRARRAFGTAEARGGVVVAHVVGVVRFWKEKLRVPGTGRGFPRVFGRDERRLWGMVERLLGAWGEVYHDVGVMVRDFFEEGAEMYCGMQ